MNFVTGGTGLVGAHIIFDLLSRGEKVRALKRPASDLSFTEALFKFYDKKELFNQIEWVDGDLLDVHSLIDATTNIDYVYHAAAIIAFDKKSRDKMIKSNIEGTANLLAACSENKIKKFGHVSSVATLGKSKNGSPLDENCHWELNKENSQYAISKYGAEREVWRASEEGLDVVIVNPSIILGPGNWNRSSTKLYKSAQSGMKYYTSGSSGFVDVRDVSEAIIRLVKSEIISERFILNGTNATYKEVFSKIARAFGKEAPYKEAKPWQLNVARRLLAMKSFFTGKPASLTKESARSSLKQTSFDSSKIKNGLDFTFRPFDDSITDGVKFIEEFYLPYSS